MAYIYDLADVWASAGTTFTAIKMNVTDTASASASLLMDLQVGGGTRFRVGKTGIIFVQDALDSGGVISAGSNGFRTIQFGGGTLGSNGIFAVRDNSQVVVRGQGGFSWESAGNNPASGTIDLTLARDAANTLAQRNGVNPQAFNLYDTYTDASNYRRTSMYWTGGAFFIDNDLNAGTGITNASFWIKSRGNIYLSQGGGGYDVVTNANGSGSFYPGGTTNTTNLGRSDKTFALGYFGTAAIIGGYVQVTEMTAPAAPATNNVRIYAEDDGAGKTRLMARFATGAAQQIAIEP